MSPINIRKGDALLQRAGTTFDDQAFIGPLQRPVYLVYVSAFLQEDVDKYAKLFDHGVEGQWLSHANDPTGLLRVVDAGPPCAVPKLTISSILENPPLAKKMKVYPFQEPRELMDLPLVVQGKDASGRSKVVVARSFEDAATSMLHEAINGFSVVFTGALLRSDMNHLFSSKRSRPFDFKKVPDVAALNNFSTKTTRDCGKIGILC
ncbi:MAG: hypothetical protein LQ346_004764 [Caloplaca aetnensis]|nr:MAG: hypothetical protein LQ346_004764 [Caloplaca aetnensis]